MLDPDQRAAVVLRHLLEYTPGEIATLLELPRGTVNSRLRRALDRLAAELAPMSRRSAVRAPPARRAARRAHRRGRPRRSGAPGTWCARLTRRARRSRRNRRAVRLAVAAATAVVAAALALTPAGAKMGDWIDDVVSPAPQVSRSSLTSLPAKGRLLVVADGGAWLVRDDGARRQLGAFSDATWSPGGLFVAAARGRELVALDPQGHERWTLPATGRVSVPRWSPDGFRIAYRSGRDLRVATGDSTDDWLLARGRGRSPAGLEAAGRARRAGPRVCRRRTRADRRGRPAPSPARRDAAGANAA